MSNWNITILFIDMGHCNRNPSDIPTSTRPHPRVSSFVPRFREHVSLHSRDYSAIFYIIFPTLKLLSLVIDRPSRENIGKLFHFHAINAVKVMVISAQQLFFP